ncbi:MAG: penicillin-binding protein, partial [Rhodospirillales bacterium]|nr:penicillin-binding protein [Rhodospirillales bacterium]
FSLYQIPNVDGALVALDPHTGRVLAMSGGYSFERSQFNRVTQANRQPGSAFKPFVYLAAIEGGYTPSTLILDAPFVIDQGPGLPKWRPANYTNKFYGPSTMRLGLEKSRNLMTVRLAQTVGMEKVAAAAERFGVVDKLPEALSMALGSSETTLLRLTTAYAMLVNGGKQITPTLIDRIQDRHGATIFRHDRRPCPNCRATAWTDQPVPQIPDTRKALTDPGSAYQVVNMLRGVIERGTGKRIQAVGKPLAGKTGTTNDEKDTWFIGFTPDLAVGVFIGFDEPKPLGRQETGSSVSAPVFRDFMTAALKDKPAIPFRIPPNIRLVRVNVTTGELARPGDSDVILEAFKPGTVPAGRSEVLEGQSWIAGGEGLAPATGTGGLY